MAMFSKSAWAAAGLAALVASACTEAPRSTTKVGQDIVLSRPDGCEKVLDIRREQGSEYQVLCETSQKEVALYFRSNHNDYWRRIYVR
jgi:hypothetical protein